MMEKFTRLILENVIQTVINTNEFTDRVYIGVSSHARDKRASFDIEIRHSLQAETVEPKQVFKREFVTLFRLV